MAFWLSPAWFRERAQKREQQAIETFLSLLQSEGEEVQKLKNILLQIKAEQNPAKKAGLAVQFEREFLQYEEAEHMLESIDKKFLRKTLFKGIVEKSEAA